MAAFNLTVSVDSYFGPAWRLEVLAQKAVLHKSRDGQTTENKSFDLTTETASCFEKRLADIGIFAWEPHYLDCCMLDGSSWFVSVRSKGRQVESRGTNGYPSNWQDFIEVIKELLESEDSFL